MLESLLFELLLSKFLYDYREELEKNQNEFSGKAMRKSKQKLLDELDEEKRELFDRFVFDFDLYYTYLYHNVCVKLLNYSVLIGMQLQKAFDEDNA